MRTEEEQEEFNKYTSRINHKFIWHVYRWIDINEKTEEEREEENIVSYNSLKRKINT